MADKPLIRQCRRHNGCHINSNKSTWFVVPISHSRSSSEKKELQFTLQRHRAVWPVNGDNDVEAEISQNYCSVSVALLKKGWPRPARPGGDDDVGVDRRWPYRAAQPCQLHVNGYRYTPPTAPLVVFPIALKSSTSRYPSTWWIPPGTCWLRECQGTCKLLSDPIKSILIHTLHCPLVLQWNVFHLTATPWYLNTLGTWIMSWSYFSQVHGNTAEYSGGYQLRAGPISINTQCLKYCPPPLPCTTRQFSWQVPKKRFCKSWFGHNHHVFVEILLPLC